MKKNDLLDLVEKCYQIKKIYRGSNLHDEIDESTFWDSLKYFVEYANHLPMEMKKSIHLLKRLIEIKINIDNLKNQERDAKLSGLAEKVSSCHRSILSNYEDFASTVKAIEKKANDLLEDIDEKPSCVSASVKKLKNYPDNSKAIDFLFDQLRKILDEYRKPREDNSSKDIENINTHKNSDEQPNKMISFIMGVEAKKINESLWLSSEKKVKHLMSLLEIYSRNYSLAKEQYAKWGSALAPPIIVNNLKEAEDNIENTVKEIELILSRIYGKKINIGDL